MSRQIHDLDPGAAEAEVGEQAAERLSMPGEGWIAEGELAVPVVEEVVAEAEERRAWMMTAAGGRWGLGEVAQAASWTAVEEAARWRRQSWAAVVEEPAMIGDCCCCLSEEAAEERGPDRRAEEAVSAGR